MAYLILSIFIIFFLLAIFIRPLFYFYQNLKENKDNKDKEKYYLEVLEKNGYLVIMEKEKTPEKDNRLINQAKYYLKKRGYKVRKAKGGQMPPPKI